MFSITRNYNETYFDVEISNMFYKDFACPGKLDVFL